MSRKNGDGREENGQERHSRYAQEDALRRRKLAGHGLVYKLGVCLLILLIVLAAAVLVFIYGMHGMIQAGDLYFSDGTAQLPVYEGKGVRFFDTEGEQITLWSLLHPGSGFEGEDSGAAPDGTEGFTEAETETEPVTELVFTPHAAESTAPEKWMETTELQYNGEAVSAEDFQPWYQMDFRYPEKYTDVDGLVTFRGDNFRSGPVYGNADIQNKTIESLWSQGTGSLTYKGATWSGSGWTGQPLMAKWPRNVKQHMNMADFAKQKDDLVEVIYACMDGYIYFLDLETGQQTRDPLYLGYPFKGAGALDPRGYPVMYVGAGYDSASGPAKVFVINLLDCSVMYTFGDNDSFSLRGQLSYFDSSALVDAESDTLIYPGENGILYLIHLNTDYDEQKGTLSIDPDKFLKWHYWGKRTQSGQFWVGMEDSAAVYEGFLFIAENGGHLMCLDLNSMQLVWVTDILDDSNSTPVLSIEDGHLYLYVSTSFRLGWRSSTTAEVPIWKIDAVTGETVWHTDYECYSQDGVSGGVQSTIAPGKETLSNYIYVTVSMTKDPYSGCLVCLNKKTGQIVWEHESAYAWSSPVCVYNADGIGYVIYCDAGGQMYLLDGITGQVYSQIALSDGVIEASPAVYDSFAVVGTRAGKIWGLRLQ